MHSPDNLQRVINYITECHRKIDLTAYSRPKFVAKFRKNLSTNLTMRAQIWYICRENRSRQISEIVKYPLPPPLQPTPIDE